MSSLTKIFIVLQLVFSLTVAVVLVMAVSRIEPMKAQLDKSNQIQLAAQAGLAKATNDNEALRAENQQIKSDLSKSSGDWARQVDALKTEKGMLENARDAADAKNSQMQNALTQTTASLESATKRLETTQPELQRLTQENVKLIQQNAELNRANNEAVTALKFAEQAIRKLQEELTIKSAESPKGGAAVSGESGQVANLTVQAAAQINGKVTSVAESGGRTLIEVPLGSRDGVKVNTRYVIQRNNSYVGDAVVLRVSPDSSVAATDTMKKGETVQAGDIVTAGSGQ